ncbi:MAG: biotin--[acetyl-CoA-carboxylase] ligase [Planctomycetales bacterium]|nr:biotin--[acetyl-CoA-carboxylase] ligase [Planctomycetales bacterium]
MPDSHAFTLESLRRVADETFLAALDFHRELPSTNDRALAIAADVERVTPLLVLAETQTAGRGRGNNRWWAGPGALTFSLIVDGGRIAVPTDRWPQIALTVGLAVCESVERLRPGLNVGLKWPNDVYLDDRKLCGILVEVPSQASGRVIIGVGVNVNNSYSSAPAEIQRTAVSLRDAAGFEFSLPEVLTEMLQSLESQFERLANDHGHLVRRWSDYCLLSGRHVRVRWGETVTEGRCIGVDDDGALLVDTQDGTRRCVAGVVESFERG